MTSNFEQGKPIAFVTLYAGEESSVPFNSTANVLLLAYKSPGSPFIGRVETKLNTSKINDADFANLNMTSKRNFAKLVYTSPIVPIANRTVDEITIRDNESKDILHRFPILLY